MEIHDFSINMRLISSNSSHVSMVFIFEPKLGGPAMQELVNFVIKRIAGMGVVDRAKVCSKD